MRSVIDRLFKRRYSEAIEREIEEELDFHLEQLTDDYLQRDMSLLEAKDAALKRFGNVERIKDQCVEISKNGHALIHALKFLFIIVFFAGVLLRVFGTDYHVVRVGDVLIMIAILGRLFIYVRGLHPSSFRSRSEDSTPLMLNDKAQASFMACGQGSLTPVERVIADK